jgi:hypothetical protein
MIRGSPTCVVIRPNAPELKLVTGLPQLKLTLPPLPDGSELERGGYFVEMYDSVPFSPVYFQTLA